jgi:PAS domain S-box-containing protein
MIGHPIWQFVSEHEREESRRAVLEKLAGVRPLRVFEREYERADGSRMALQIHENLIHDDTGRISGIRTSMLDVTEKKAREQAEADSTAIRGILERIGDAYMTFDTEWRYTYVNPKAAELARKPAEELLGRRVWDVFPDAVQTRFYTELTRAMKEQVPSDFENFFAPLGMWFENSVYPSPSGVAVFYRDITERKRTQQTLEQKTAELARKNADLETFAYLASHDLQQPLRMIGSFTRLLAQRYKGAIDADADEFISYTLEGVDRMQRLISDLLRLCRVGTPDPARITRVNPNAVLDYVRDHLSGMIEESKATIRAGELPPILFVETHLIQLFQNLIANSIKYKGVDPPVIEITAERQQDGWMFVVRDNGRGFDMQYADKVFKPFKRLDRTDDSGTGIGLAICRKIVESHGGRMWVESEPGVGSVFSFTVPDEIPIS